MVCEPARVLPNMIAARSEQCVVSPCAAHLVVVAGSCGASLFTFTV